MYHTILNDYTIYNTIGEHKAEVKFHNDLGHFKPGRFQGSAKTTGRGGGKGGDDGCCNVM